jgi:hypothetical protein
MAFPPDLLLIYCCQPALYGGDSLLVDGKQIYHYLEKESPALLRKLFKLNSAVFGIERFQEMGDDRLLLRFRADHLSFFDHSIHLAVAKFLKSLEPLKYNQHSMERDSTFGFVSHRRQISKATDSLS